MISPRRLLLVPALTALTAACVVAAGCGSDATVGTVGASGTGGSSGREAASAGQACPGVANARRDVFYVRNESSRPIVLRASDWSCTDSATGFVYSDDSTPGQLEGLRVEPGQRVSGLMRWQWRPDQATTPPGDGYVWLGGFRLGIDEEAGGKARPVVIKGATTQPFALLARSLGGTPSDRGYAPVTDVETVLNAARSLRPLSFPAIRPDGTPAKIEVRLYRPQKVIVTFTTP